MAGLDARKSDVSDLRSRFIKRKSGTPDFRAIHAFLSECAARRGWPASQTSVRSLRKLDCGPAMTWRDGSIRLEFGLAISNRCKPSHERTNRRIVRHRLARSTERRRSAERRGLPRGGCGQLP